MSIYGTHTHMNKQVVEPVSHIHSRIKRKRDIESDDVDHTVGGLF